VNIKLPVPAFPRGRAEVGVVRNIGIESQDCKWFLLSSEKTKETK
jgi:hypothetical protein